MAGREKNIACIGIGSNLGDKVENCREAIERIAAAPGNELMARSSFYRTEPWGMEDQDWFVNAAIRIETVFDPQGLLQFLRSVEKGLRKEKARQWGPRNIDLDILLVNEDIIRTPELTVPHPFLHERRFVLVPLEEVCPDLMHPVFRCPVKELLRRTEDRKEVAVL